MCGGNPGDSMFDLCPLRLKAEASRCCQQTILGRLQMDASIRNSFRSIFYTF